MVTANILDPIHETLTPEVWDDPGAPEPKLKEQHRKWIIDTVVGVLKKSGYTHVESWLSLVLTGSLTTYQYDKGSDVDVSLFVDAEHFPEWSRAEMIGTMITHVDGTNLPGTQYPMQCFVVPPDVSREDLYKPGLRSGYDLMADHWIQPPEPERVMDVKSQLPAFYAYALEQADKMQALIKYEPEKAKLLWHQIHERRRRDQKAGKGDYAQSNIVYKFLANEGLFPEIAELTGDYIAKAGGFLPRYTPIDPSHIKHRIDQLAVEQAARHIGIKDPVAIRQVGGVSGGYHGPDEKGVHQVSVVGWLTPEAASRQTWHELAHAKQYEDGERFGIGYHDAYEQGHDAYKAHPTEVEADLWGSRNPFPLAHPVAKVAFAPRQVAKFVYDPIDNKIVIGPMAAEEGVVESHAQLARIGGINLANKPVWGQIHEDGMVESFGRPRIDGFGPGKLNQYEAAWRLSKALESIVPGAKMKREPSYNPAWEERYVPPEVVYTAEPPQINTAAPEQAPWTFT